ncbi:MAG: ABC transporter permease [Bacilli bacterium]
MTKQIAKTQKKSFSKPAEGLKSVGASLICILAGILIGFLIMLVSAPALKDANAKPLEGLLYLFSGPFTAAKKIKSLGNMIFYSVPLIFTSLSVAVAYKTGLFNIGAPGQFMVGTMFSLLVALNIDSTGNTGKGVGVWILAVFVAALGGMIWGMIPGLLKAFFGINEVIVTIMTNWIAANMFSWVFSLDSMAHLRNTKMGMTAYLITTDITGNATPDLGLGNLTQGSYLDIGIFVAVIVAILCWLLMTKTTRGYSMRACGLNRYSARYAGINDRFNIVFAMALAGALAGLGGAFYYLHGKDIQYQWMSAYSKLPVEGFNGIAGAFLANCNPLACVFAAIFIKYIAAAGDNLTSVGYNKYFADIIIAVIIYLAGFTNFFRNFLSFRKKDNNKEEISALHTRILLKGLGKEEGGRK